MVIGRAGKKTLHCPFLQPAEAGLLSLKGTPSCNSFTGPRVNACVRVRVRVRVDIPDSGDILRLKHRRGLRIASRLWDSCQPDLAGPRCDL